MSNPFFLHIAARLREPSACVQYDAEAREHYLRKLKNRGSPTGDLKPELYVIPFKVPYFPQLYRLGLMRRMKKLIDELRQATDEGFLKGPVNVVVANTVRKNNFIVSYRQNFLLTTTDAGAGCQQDG